MIHFDIANLEKELKELEQQTTSQEFWENQQNTSQVLKRITEIKNKVEEYKGKITEIYNSIFIVKLDDTKNKSFCYSDVLTNNIQLYFDNM